MRTPENDESAQQALRVAQLEIKLLREQLLKSMNETQAAREEAQKQTGSPVPKVPAPVPPAAPTQAAAIDFKLPAATCARDRQVLCVEDSAANFELIESILIDRPGTNLRWADSGGKGVEMAKANTPELVLLDLDLPDMHGSEVLGHLRAEAATAETPVIVISADATPSQIERMLAAGARDYITKPFEIRRFLLMFDEIFPQAALG
ncbi:MAG: response regulator [Chthoniobacterales bacterium]|nr:response regulator [Chthoniobacterales bacterium]